MADFWHFCNKIPLLQAQSFGVTVQRPHLTSPIEGEETFFPRPWWEGLGEGVNCYTKANKAQSIKCFFIDCPRLFCFNFYHISNWFFNDQEFQRVGWVKRSGPINNVCFLMGVLALHPSYIITMVVSSTNSRRRTN